MDNKKMKLAGGIFAVYIGIISFFLERLWFDMGSVATHRSAYFLAKAILIIGAYLLFVTIYTFKSSVMFRRILIIYLSLMFLMLLITWPGIWRWDEFFVLDGSKYFVYNSYQHYFTSLFYMASLMIFPFPAGVVIVQILIISVLVGVIIFQLNRHVIKNERLSYLLLIPFLFFPVIDSNLYPLRASLYAFAEVLFLLFLAISAIRIKSENYKISNIMCGSYILLSIVLAVWRSEGLYYAIVAPVIFCVIFHKQMHVIKKIIVFATIVCGSMLLSGYQNRLLYDSIGNQNTIISTLPYIEYVIHDETITGKETELIGKIDKVIDLDVLEEQGGGAIWDSSVSLIREDYTDSEYSEYLKSYASLVFKHLYSFARVQVPVILQANGLKLGTQYVEHTENLFSCEGVYASENVQNIFFGQALTKPIFPGLRRNVVIVLEALLVNDSLIMRLVHRVMYNALIPMLFLFVAMICCLKERNIILGILFGFPLFRAVILAGTIPGSAFMYWYSIYLVGYIYIFVVLLRFLEQRKHLLGRSG